MTLQLLFLATLGLSLMAALVLGISWWEKRDQASPGVGEWALGIGLIALGNFGFLIREHLPGLLNVVASNGLHIAALALLVRGMRRFRGRTAPWWPLALAVAAFLLLFGSFAAAGQLTGRVVVYSTWSGVLCTLLGLETLRQRPPYAGLHDGLLGAVTLLVAASYFVRVGAALIMQPVVEVTLSLTGVHAWVSLGQVMTMPLVTMLFISLHAARSEYEWREASERLGRLVAEHQATETELRASEGRYRLLAEHATDVIWTMDLASGRFTYVSPSVQRLRGYTPAEVMAQPVMAALTPASAAQVQTELAELLRDPDLPDVTAPRVRELDQPHRDGHLVPTEVVTQLLRDEQGRPVTVLGVSRDITLRRQAEAELRRHREQLEQLVEARTEELARARDAAEAANAAKTAFLANMSHELRTPMNAIMGLTELALRRVQDERMREQLGKIRRASQQLLALINDILDISRLETSALALDQTPFTLDRVFEDLRRLLAPRAADQGLTLQLDLPASLQGLPLRGDPLRLGQILQKLASNAVKFTTRGDVTVRARVAAETPDQLLLRLEVQDTGPGISPEDQARLFQRFEQLDTSLTRVHGGSGLGLAIARGLAERMGGSIGVNSAPGRGSTFWVVVRLARADAPSAAAPPPGPPEGTTPAPEPVPAAAVVPPSPAAEAQLRGHHRGAEVLLVEDEPVNQEVLRDLLQEAGLRVELATDGAQACERVRERRYDLILMDLQMPRLNGLDATRAIRQLPHGREVPIVATTANAFDEDRQACLAAGMNDHIAKPIEPARLFDTVARWLAHARPPQAHPAEPDGNAVRS